MWSLLKPVFDVIRYLGDDTLRDYVHEQLDRILRSIDNRERIIVVAHSLGSVIAIDSILSEHALWATFGRVDLITAGSPLNRLLHRFFPLAYPHLTEIVENMATLHTDLSWTNIYRRTDYVGGKLPDRRISNQPVWQGLWRNHVNYWGDPFIGDRIFAALDTRRPLKTARAASVDGSLLLSDRLPKTELRFSPSMSYITIPLTITGFIGIVWSQFYWTPHEELLNLEEWQRRATMYKIATLESAGIVDNATEDRTRFEGIALHYSVNGETYGAESSPAVLFYAPPRFPHVDWVALEQHLDKADIGKIGIGIQYAPEEPRIFMVPGYDMMPSYYSFGRVIFYLMRCFLLSISWVIWCGAAYVLLAGLSNEIYEQS